jgi:hypothetical protein
VLADNLRYQILSAGLLQNLGFVDLIDADPRHPGRHRPGRRGRVRQWAGGMAWFSPSLNGH